MKNYFKIGLMALTLAFGVTSCDKDDNGGSAVNALSLEAQGLASKITFTESGGIAAPKGFKNLTGKNAGEFTNIYSSTPQILSIVGVGADAVEVYTGNYTPGDISTIVPTSVTLSNGDYVATSSNASNTSAEVVLGYLPYTSTIAFNLAESGSIELAATVERGFLIVNAEDALDGSRVTGATANGSDLIGPDDEGDFYGYLLAGNHDIIVNYTLDGTSIPINGAVNIGIGSAYTIDLMLTANVAVTERRTSETVTRVESLIGEDLDEDGLPDNGEGRDLNTDGDFLDVYSRLETMVFITTGDEDEVLDRLIRGQWSIVTDNSDLSFNGETGTGTTTGTTTDVPNSGTSTETTDGGDVDPPAEDPADAWVSNGDTIGGDETFTNDGDPTLEYSYDGSSYGTLAAAKALANAAITAEGDTDVAIQVRSIQARLRQVSAIIQPEIYVVNGDQDGDVLVDTTRETLVVTAAIVDGVAAVVNTAGDDVSYTVSNAVTPPADAEWAEANGVYTHADFAGYSFTIIDDLFSASDLIAEVSLNGAVESYQGGDAADEEAVIAAAKAYIETK